MAVKKLKWPQLMTNLNPAVILEVMEADIDEIDSAINDELQGGGEGLGDLKNEIYRILYPNPESGNVWQDLDIYISSFKEHDRRFIFLLQAKLREYVAFYRRVLTDAGVQRQLVYSKLYNNSGSANSTERGTTSVTPQNSNLYDPQHPESDSLFDVAIANFASNIDKNKASSTSSSQGNSSTTVTGTTWEEGKKNLQMLFFNELKDYMMSIPERIYSYYSLETIPAPELYKKLLDNLFETRDMLINE